MVTTRWVRSIAAVSALTAFGTAGCGSEASSSNEADSGVVEVIIGPDQIGGVELGMSMADIEKAGIKFESQQLDEVCGGGTGVTVMKFDETIGFAQLHEDKVDSVSSSIEGAVTPEGVGVGDAIDDVNRVYGDDAVVTVDDSPVEVFGHIAVTVEFDDPERPSIEFGADPETNEIGSIALPRIRYCE